MLYRVTILLLAGLFMWGSAVLPAHAQQVLDQQFEYLLQQDPQALQTGTVSVPPMLQRAQVSLADGTIAYRAFVQTDDPERLRREGIAVQSHQGEIATVRARLGDLQTLSSMEGVTRVTVPAVLEPHNDEAAGDMGAVPLHEGAINNTEYQGQGMLSCVIDSGIDVNHDDFKDANGDTRIQYLWDQTDNTGPSPEDRDAAFSGLDHGTEYTASDIDGGGVNQEDIDGHGTHVAGTMAGNGRALLEAGETNAPRHVGIAPQSDLIVVKAGDGGFSGANVADALSYCGILSDEESQPVVANMSLGTSFGPHDGTSALAQITDAFTSNGTDMGRLAVTSAGNSGSPAQRQHVSGTINGNSTASEDWEVDEAPSGSSFGINAWLDGEPAVEVTVTTPGNETATLDLDANDGDSDMTDTPDGRIWLISEVNNPNDDRSIIIQLSNDGGDDVAEGMWSIDITNNEGASLDYHAWTFDVSTGASAAFVNGDNAYTIGSPGTAASALTVGAHVHRWRWTDTDGSARAVSGNFDDSDAIAAFSSRGPLRDGSIKPDVTGPGQMMASAYSQDMNPQPPNTVVMEGDLHRLTQGTSMSAPAVAGAAVLLFQEAPTLTGNEVKDLLMDHTTVDTAVENWGTPPNTSFGSGKANVLEAMSALLGGSGEREMLWYEAPWDFNAYAPTTVGGGTSDAAALRFTPSFDGFATGTYITPGANGTDNLNDPLEVEIWTDDGGSPDQQIGQTVTVDADMLSPFGPNYISLMDAEAAVNEGTDYHIVVQPQTASDEIVLAAENGSTASGRSQVLDGDNWSGTGTNLIIRAEVASTDGVSGALPVELASFNATVQGESVALNWHTLSETDNSGFMVEHRPVQEEATTFSELGFVEGYGTTDEPQSYSFTTDELSVGEHEFRLRQIDVDGTETLESPLTVHIGMQEAYQLSSPYPNPSTSVTRFDLAVREAQDVTATVYNVLGQRVATVHDGAVAAETPLSLSVDDLGLSSGTYFLRVTGDSFSTHRQFVRVR